MRAWRGSVLAAVIGAAAVGGSACRKEEDTSAKKGGAPAKGVVLLKAQPIQGTPLAIQLPRGWTFERLEGSDAPEPDGPPPGLVDLSETREVWKATAPSPTGRVDPFVLVAMDPRLPKGTTAMRYLEALRNEQSKSSKTRVRHLETERIEREGRPGYSLRDAMDVPLPTGGSAPLIQFARMFVDGSRGLTVTCMMLQDDAAQMDAEIRAMMESVRFTTKPPRDPGEDSLP